MGRERKVVRLPHPVRIVNEEKLAEMMAYGSGVEVLARTAQPPSGFGLCRKVIVDFLARDPGRAPSSLRHSSAASVRTQDMRSQCTLAALPTTARQADTSLMP